jgi:hypothetical protein
MVQVGTSKISGCTISLQAAVHPGASATGTQNLKKGKELSDSVFFLNYWYINIYFTFLILEYCLMLFI